MITAFRISVLAIANYALVVLCVIVMGRWPVSNSTRVLTATSAVCTQLYHISLANEPPRSTGSPSVCILDTANGQGVPADVELVLKKYRGWGLSNVLRLYMKVKIYRRKQKWF